MSYVLYSMFFSKVYGIRGAVCSENTKEDIQKNTVRLFETLLKKNNLNQKNIVSVVFSVTKDITVFNPAAALRAFGFANNCALFCCAEADIESSLPKTIRVLITAYMKHKPVHSYLNGAEILRPDLNECGIKK